jgi:hypothetical protein
MIEKNKFWGKRINEQIKLFSDYDINIPYAIIKGEPLSVLAYGNYGMREYGDMDILVDKKDLKTMENVLQKNNYIMDYNKNLLTKHESRFIPLFYSHQLLPYRKIVNKMIYSIDLNHDIFWGEYKGNRVNISEFLSDAMEMEIYGVKAKTLPPLKTMIQLILHHYKDMNSIFLLATRKSIKYDMFKDVYFLFKNNLNDLLLERFYTVSMEYEIIPYVYYILYYTGLLFEDDTLKLYINAFKTQEGENLLNCYGLNETERREWKCDFITRLEGGNLYDIIKNDLNNRDYEKITLNRKVFMGE